MSDHFFEQNQPGKMNSLTSQEAKDIVKLVTSKFNNFKQARVQKEERWKECVKAFLNQHNHEPSGTSKWRYQIYVPLSYEAATNIHSNLKRSLFPTDSAFFSIEGRDKFSNTYANQIKTALLYQLDDMDFLTKFGCFIKQMVIIGNSAAIISWKQVKRRVKEKQEVPVFNVEGVQTGTKKKMVEVEHLVYNGPEFETINMFDIVFDTSTPNWDEGMIIHRSYRTYEEIKNNPVYKNTGVIDISKHSINDQYVIESSQAFDMGDKQNDAKGMIKLYSAYGDFKIGNKIYYDHIAVIANAEHLIRFDANPYEKKPFIFCMYESIPNELYGIGAIEPGLGIQNLVNTFSNQKSDVLSLIINGMWAYVDDGIIDPEEIVAKPGALIPVKHTNNIQPLHPDTTIALSYNEIAQLKAEYQEVTGATKYFTGGPIGDLTKTATEVSALQSAGVVRFSEIIQNLEQNALKPAINLVLDYNEKFNVLEKSIKMTENSTNHFLKLGHAGFMQNLKLKITGSNSSISKNIKIKKLMEFIQMISSSPMLAQQINIMEMVKQLYRELGFKDESNVF